MPPPADGPCGEWWRAFFESPDSLRLAFFPDEHTTSQQVDGLDRVMGPWAPRRVLDLCCGHGRHMVPLLQRGYRMVGIDAAHLMVTRASQAAREAGAPARIARGLAQRLPFGSGVFDVVLFLFNSFGYLPTDEQNEQVIREVERCLQPGGRLLLDTRNRSYQLSYLPFSEIVPVQAGDAVWLECKHDAARGRLVSEFRCAGSGKLLYRASIRSYTMRELADMLGRCGLQIDATFGGYDWRPFRGNSRELLILACKP